MTISKRRIAYVADYDYADDSLLTSLHHEETRVKAYQKLRQVQSVLKERELTSGSDELIFNAKKAQQEQDRKQIIERDNRLLLERLEDIHENLPKQFDMCHLSEETLNAPRISTLKLRRRRQDSIRKENQRLRKRLINLKSNFSLKQLAADALKADYFASQISKVDRRRKVRDATKLVADQMMIQNAMRIPFASMHALDPTNDSLLSCAMASASAPTKNSLLHQGTNPMATLSASPVKPTKVTSPLKSPPGKPSLVHHSSSNNSDHSNSNSSSASTSNSSTGGKSTAQSPSKTPSPFQALGPPPSVEKLKSPSRPSPTPNPSPARASSPSGEFFPTLKNTTKHIHSCDLPAL